MRLLGDTCPFLWLATDDPELSPPARAACRAYPYPPGSFDRRHRLPGELAFVGLCLSSATGKAMYVMGSRSDPDDRAATVA